MNLFQQLGVNLPIIQAPMAGNITTPELVFEVCNADAIGSLAAAYLSPEEIKKAIHDIRLQTNKPFNVNLFIQPTIPIPIIDSLPMMKIMEEVHSYLNISPPILPKSVVSNFDEQFKAVLEFQPAIFSFTFGALKAGEVKALKKRGIYIIGTATNVEEAILLQELKVDAIVAQSCEAGGHRGTFIGAFEDSLIPLNNLLTQLNNKITIPIIAAGGIMDGKDIAAAIKLGAIGAQMGTAFLTCKESGASFLYKQALLAAKKDNTIITKAFSGRPARGYRNIFTEKLANKEDIILPFPIQNKLTKPMREFSAQNNIEYFSLWAGQNLTKTRDVTVKDLINQLVQESGL